MYSPESSISLARVESRNPAGIAPNALKTSARLVYKEESKSPTEKDCWIASSFVDITYTDTHLFDRCSQLCPKVTSPPRSDRLGSYTERRCNSCMN